MQTHLSKYVHFLFPLYTHLHLHKCHLHITLSIHNTFPSQVSFSLLFSSLPFLYTYWHLHAMHWHAASTMCPSQYLLFIFHSLYSSASIHMQAHNYSHPHLHTSMPMCLYAHIYHPHQIVSILFFWLTLIHVHMPSKYTCIT